MIVPCQKSVGEVFSMTHILSERAFRISVLILFFFAVVCTRLPLLNYLGYEFSALTVLIAGYLCGLLTLSQWKKSRCSSKADVWKFIGETAIIQMVFVVVPMLISLANSVFVKNCSIGDGLVLYALTAIPGACFSVSLSFFIGVILERWRKTAFTVFYIVVLLHIPLVTFFRPQIFAYNPILGFFPGISYDETLLVTQRLLIYRLGTLAVSACILAAAVWIWQIRFFRKKKNTDFLHSFPLMELSLFAVFLPAVFVMISFSDRLGFSSSKQYIQQKLAGNYKTAHFEIIYPAGSVKRERIEQIGRLHEYYYRNLTQKLNIQFQKPIISFLYSSPEEKGKLIGAGRTDISKPWLRQIHINLADVEAGLRHEMVHVLAAEFGWSPLMISHNSGLVEGIAVAVGDDVWYDEPLDRAAALVFVSGIHPDLESLFSFSGFAKMNAGVSYALAGSFSKFLIDSFGIDQFKKLYFSGDFVLIYKRDLPSLLSDWRTIIQRQQFTSNDSIKAHYLFHRSSIFGKECARVIANINSESNDFLRQREFEKALASSEKSLSLSRTAQAVFQKSAALFEMQRFEEVVHFTVAQLHDTTFGSSLLPLHLQLGDAYWAMDSLNEATQEYEMLANVHLNSWYDEACALRLESMRQERDHNHLQIYFTRSMEDTNRMEWLVKLSSSPAKYLLARDLAGKEKYREACSLFETIGVLDNRILEFFRQRRLGRVYFLMQEWRKAEKLFAKALLIAPTSSLRIEMNEWIERCEFDSTLSSEGFLPR
jgi:tetratricopeptide (TPR) repeat protein